MPHTNAILIEPSHTAPGGLTIDQTIKAFLAGFSSPGTRRAYEYDLRDWTTFCTKYQLHPLHVRRTHVEIYARELERTSYSNSTRARRISTLRSFFGWCYDEELIDGNPAGRVKLPPQRRPPMPSLNKHELHRFLDAAETVSTADETAGILILALCAIRVSEMCDATIRDVEIRNWNAMLHIVGKGDKPHVVVVPPRTMHALDVAHDGRTSGPLLLNREGRQMTPFNMRRAVRRAAKAAGLADRQLTPHALRRSAIEIALHSGQSLRDVQLWVNHASSRTTEWYDRRQLTPERSPGYTVQSAVA